MHEINCKLRLTKFPIRSKTKVKVLNETIKERKTDKIVAEKWDLQTELASVASRTDTRFEGEANLV